MKVKDFSWPAREGGRALEMLASFARLSPRDVRLPAGIAVGGALSEWVPRAASALGIEAEAVSARHSEVEVFVGACAPALFSVSDGNELIVVLRAHRSRAHVDVLTVDGRVVRASTLTIARALTSALEAKLEPEIELTLDAAGVSEAARRDRVRRALLTERLAAREAVVAWTLRSDLGENTPRALARLGLVRRVGLQVAAHLGRLGFMLTGWWLLGRSMFADRLDAGAVIAASLLFTCAVACEIGESWLSGSTSLRIGSWLRQRLLVGALRLRPDDVRLDGVGAQLGRVIESESVQAVALTGATAALLGVLELIAATVVLAMGAGGLIHAATLVIWITVLLIILARYVRERGKWTAERLRMSARGIERMLGYETRLVTESIDAWSIEEDRELSAYVDRSREVDARLRRLTILIARGWLLVGLLGLVPTLLVGDENALGVTVAVAIGGVLLAYEALGNVAMQAAVLVDAWIGWQQVAPLFEAAARRPKPTMGLRTKAADSAAAAPASERTLEAAAQLELRDVAFVYRGRSHPVFTGASLRIEEGDRVLIEGPSGGGKSTLASLLGGLRAPTNGLVLQAGLDIHAIGEEPWRKSAAVVPQFHENHLLTGSLAFNLLLGREWPPSSDDLVLAGQICEELGLGTLLERMPSHLMTMVGETGWQLSHGERSRVFLARALLQNAEVVILDETLAALDPDNLAVCIKTLMDRSKTLLVIAHARSGAAQH